MAKELSNKLKNLITIYWKNLYHAQNFQKQAYNKNVKPKSCTLSDKD